MKALRTLFVLATLLLSPGFPRQVQAQNVVLPIAPVELPAPVVCDSITVFDQDDVGTLCANSVTNARTVTDPACPQVVTGAVKLEVDLLCLDTTGLIVGSDNTVINLNGHRIICMSASGYLGSCQGGDSDVGIEISGFDNVHLFSNIPGGAVEGFDIGIRVAAGAGNVKVKQLIVTGPTAGPLVDPRPFIPNNFGIHVRDAACGDGTVYLGGGTKTGNDISHHTVGVVLSQGSCVFVGHNLIHDNTTTFVNSHGISVGGGGNNHFRANVVIRNGAPNAAGNTENNAGLLLEDTFDNLITQNQFNENFGNGVWTRFEASGNYIVNNQMLFNQFFDARSDPTAINDWNENNRCQTQTTPEPPPGVCYPGDIPPPQ